MTYSSVVEATFLSRPNRFLANVKRNGFCETVHVKNTGRCRELLIPGCRVYLADAGNWNWKTRYDLIAVEKEREGQAPLLINMDSQLPNKVAEEWLKTGTLFSSEATIQRERPWGTSRFDFYVEDGERRSFLEVKGVTLEQDGTAMFPDAPTQRGIKHLKELCACKAQGMDAYVLFVIQMKGVHVFRPNDDTHPAFGNALREAAACGVTLLAVDCLVTKDSVVIDQAIPIELN